MVRAYLYTTEKKQLTHLMVLGHGSSSPSSTEGRLLSAFWAASIGATLLLRSCSFNPARPGPLSSAHRALISCNAAESSLATASLVGMGAASAEPAISRMRPKR